MNRSSSLRRVPLKSRRAPMARQPIRAVSKKRRRENRQRRTVLLEAFGPNPQCAIRWDGRCRGWADAGHELLKRSRGGSITDVSNVVPACNPCNGAVEDEPVEAHSRGWARHSWEDAA